VRVVCVNLHAFNSQDVHNALFINSKTSQCPTQHKTVCSRMARRYFICSRQLTCWYLDDGVAVLMCWTVLMCWCVNALMCRCVDVLRCVDAYWKKRNFQNFRDFAKFFVFCYRNIFSKGFEKCYKGGRTGVTINVTLFFGVTKVGGKPT
jgi:hypothetical protein